MTSNNQMEKRQAKLILEDGSEYSGWSFGKNRCAAGEVAINTGMNGMVQALTDPGSFGQIFVSTYPMAGNCGVPVRKNGSPYFDNYGIPVSLESEKIQVSGLVVSEFCEDVGHYSSGLTLSSWLKKENIPGICGIDTRALAVRLRERGSMRAKILVQGENSVTFDSFLSCGPADVSVKEKKAYSPAASREAPCGSPPKIAIIDCGVKANVIRCFLDRAADVTRIPFKGDFSQIEYDGLFLSGGPGDPKDCRQLTEKIRGELNKNRPIFGVGLGTLIMALAAGADTFKLPSGHRGQNQPCIETSGGALTQSRCYVTSQNHGYGIRKGTLPASWQTWFTNANDGTIEGIRCAEMPYSGVLFYPEGCPGSRDSEFLFDRFIAQVKDNMK
ncbi:MAG: glutamine-hydrolyzing carbamoyl-phosphate synthase small subunit [Treponema sp.]|jgi:carbamoyl-phosphate synthase small subunit|nr:glutamine-hydrolyzing carbamoyl-phosphate synthase small subunit [Treponema sp.]